MYDPKRSSQLADSNVIRVWFHAAERDEDREAEWRTHSTGDDNCHWKPSPNIHITCSRTRCVNPYRRLVVARNSAAKASFCDTETIPNRNVAWGSETPAESCVTNSTCRAPATWHAWICHISGKNDPSPRFPDPALNNTAVLAVVVSSLAISVPPLSACASVAPFPVPW
ncbi:uncharacterized protein BJX67DRAFT_350442 [Aspergillus lucknowensis]|uniref:Uncharacterized protein n=1 Tax=Aspergillus lucknowensis TaxID=176173 RepID=A0ABR4LUZ8_9EURO